MSIAEFTVKDGTVTYYQDAVDPQNPTPQEAQEVLDYLAAEESKANALASIYAPVEVDGVLYPADPQSLAKYELAKQAKGRGKLALGVAIALDGTVTKLSTPAAVDAFHSAIEDAITARIAAVHDAL